MSKPITVVSKLASSTMSKPITVVMLEKVIKDAKRKYDAKRF